MPSSLITASVRFATICFGAGCLGVGACALENRHYNDITPRVTMVLIFMVMLYMVTILKMYGCYISVGVSPGTP